MKNITLQFKNFEADQISKEAQKAVMGGDPPIDPEHTSTPIKNGGGGNG
ncbi:rSAM-modified peptide [Flavobacterium fluviale]|uniref:RSAM-modified peptide n=1 Tax=Flavobacterium fluviale TaxID=2249356 RepID=A0A344LQF9_9FLAO|nr:rSAM-modified peptide [Flavobacterium fluviale]AXB56151.1 rSAM-modified peptide [Flavobacterium fluviale]